MWYDTRNDKVRRPKNPFSAFRTLVMLSKRIIPCLDVRDGKTTKGIRFQDNRDIGDPVQMARFYYEAGADELVFYDITASSDHRDIMIDVVRRVADEIFIPFSGKSSY